MSGILDLEQHLCITSANKVSKITHPLISAFDINHFRYLKLYHDGSRILLTNYPECIRFMYGHGYYKAMWFDGEFPNCLSNGWHVWDALRAVNCQNEITSLEKEINHNLDLFHGMTFVNSGLGFYEIYTFDSNLSTIYQINKKFLMRFIYFFKEQARELISNGNKHRLIFSQSPEMKQDLSQFKKINIFLNNTGINRYYLTGTHDDVYLTEKEVHCVYWLLKGKSAEEIASIEGNTKKTVQFHFENIRRKLNCYKQTQIVPIILKSGILDAFFDSNLP